MTLELTGGDEMTSERPTRTLDGELGYFRMMQCPYCSAKSDIKSSIQVTRDAANIIMATNQCTCNRRGTN